MCGIVGISDATGNNINEELVRALTYLQHRGQDSAGIAVVEKDGKINIHKGMGLVSQVFNEAPQVLDNSSKIGIGHVRYLTQGSVVNDEAQPFYTNSPYGIALAHNGNLTNIEYLKEYLIVKNRHINTDSDSEILLNVLAAEFSDSPTDIFETIIRVMKLLRGSYSVVAVISGVGLIAFRDPSAIRPLCFGTVGSGGEKRYMIASESVAFMGSPYRLERDLRAGECIFIDENQQMFSNNMADNPKQTPCLFEYIYFARPDSIIDGISVYEARERMGTYLAVAICRANSSNFLDIDVVIPVPETSRTYAIKLAEVLKIPYREAFVKNRYIARTFIMSNQKEKNNRSKMVKMKLSTINSEFKNKNVLIVDDSIVRGTTSKELVKIAKEAGAKRIWFASAAPPICFANRLGIDIPTDEELIAHNRSNIEIAEILDCDRVFYNDLDMVYKGLGELSVTSLDGESSVDGFEISCFSE